MAAALTAPAPAAPLTLAVLVPFLQERLVPTKPQPALAVTMPGLAATLAPWASSELVWHTTEDLQTWAADSIFGLLWPKAPLTRFTKAASAPAIETRALWTGEPFALLLGDLRPAFEGQVTGFYSALPLSSLRASHQRALVAGLARQYCATLWRLDLIND